MLPLSYLPSLMEALSQVADPRQRRGVRPRGVAKSTGAIRVDWVI